MTASLVGAIKRRTPTSLYPFARSLYHRVVAPVECWSVATADRLLGRTYEGRSLPPAALRFKVRGTPDGNAFASIGRSCARFPIACWSSRRPGPSCTAAATRNT